MENNEQKSSNPINSNAPKGVFTRFLDVVEWLGNLLPHPVTLFAIFTVLVVLLSGVAEWLNWSAVDPRPEGTPGRSPSGYIEPVSLMTADGFRRIVTELVRNFTSFAPLGVVLVALLGVGVAERSGLISAAVRSIILKAAAYKPTRRKGFIGVLQKPFLFLLTPRNLVTVAICFASVLSNTASEMGYVVLIPMAAVIFHSMGRHPLAGIACAFACVSGGYSANLLIGTVDPLLAGLTQEAARLIDADYSVHAAVNWYFMFISTFFITFIGAYVTLKIVEPKLGKYDESMAMEDVSDEVSMAPLSSKEKRALAWTGISVLVMIGVLSLTIIPENGVLRNPETGEMLNSPFLSGIVTFIFIGFLIPGFVYG